MFCHANIASSTENFIKVGHRILYFLLVVLFLILVGTIYLIFWNRARFSVKVNREETLPRPSPFIRQFGRIIEINPDICQSPECIEAADRLLRDMDASIDPCDNFYQFCCGKYEKTRSIPPEKPQISHIIEQYDNVAMQIWQLLEQPVQVNESRVFKMVKSYYQSCMNVDDVKIPSTTLLLQTLKRLGGWPVLEEDSWNPSSFNWIEAIIALKEIGYSIDYFMQLLVVTEPTNNTKRILIIDEPSFTPPKQLLLKGLEMPEISKYLKHIIDVAIALGANPDRAKLEMLDVLNLEMSLANATVEASWQKTNQTGNYPDDNMMSLTEIQKRWKFVPWMQFINRLLPVPVTVNETDRVWVQNADYLDWLEKLIQETDTRTLSNYMLWRTVYASIGYLSHDIRKFLLEYIGSALGTVDAPLWRECSLETLTSFKKVVGALFVRNYFKDGYRRDANELVENVKEAFIQMLHESSWMDSVTRDKAIEKARKMQTHIGYPVELLNDSYLEEFYHGLEMNNKQFYLNFLNLSKFITERSLKKLNQPYNKTHWIAHADAASVNGFYAKYENSFELPAGILQGLFYNNKRPKYMNYGILGMVIGHELSHGFDDNGRLYDADGNWRNWWTNETELKYLSKTKCITEQYANFTVSEIGSRLRAFRNQGENVADNVGMKLAYRAYQNWVKRNTAESKLPGLSKYTTNQLFWISAGNIWCNKFRTEGLRQQVLTDVHTLQKFRVIGSISNLVEFSKDFNCSLGSNMNPKNKCVIW